MIYRSRTATANKPLASVEATSPHPSLLCPFGQGWGGTISS